jgi:hypothetical protein
LLEALCSHKAEPLDWGIGLPDLADHGGTNNEIGGSSVKNRLFVPVVVLAGAAGLLASGTSPAAAEAPTAQPTASLECHKAAASLTVRHRAPVHTRPSAAAHVMWFAAKGKTYRIGGHCDNSIGNRRYCVAGCDFRDTPKGYWIFEEYLKR